MKENDYLGSMIDEDMRSIGGIKKRIGMGKAVSVNVRSCSEVILT